MADATPTDGHKVKDARLDDKAATVPALEAGFVEPVADEGLKRGLSSRQISMIAIGGTIGTGLFLGTGRSLAQGGPGSLLINYSLVGALVYLVMLCLGEMSTEFPIAGSFVVYSSRFVDEPFGFAIGWNYWVNDAVSYAGDLTAAQVLMEYWTDKLTWLPSLCFFFFLTGLNMIHVKAYGELEYWLSLLKVASIVVFFFVGIAVNVGANSEGRYIGGENWTLGAAPFVNGFAGFASLFVTASFAYGATESIGVTAGETKNPSRTMPRVIRRVFWRIIIFYILTVIIIGFNIPYNYPDLREKRVSTSPFTLVFQMLGSRVAGSFMNTVVLTSVLSAGNHALFAGSRILFGLSSVKMAPKMFLRTTRNGVPWVSVLFTASLALVFFGISFLPGGAAEIFTWAQNLVGVSNQIAWLCIGIASLRFRRAWKAQGRSPSDLKFQNPAGKFAPHVVIASVSFIIIVQGWSAFDGGFDALSFVSSYVELPAFALLYIIWRLIKRPPFPRLHEIDLDKGRHEETQEDMADDEQIARREKGRAGILWKMYSWIA